MKKTDTKTDKYKKTLAEIGALGIELSESLPLLAKMTVADQKNWLESDPLLAGAVALVARHAQGVRGVLQ